MRYECPKCHIVIDAIVPNVIDGLKCQFCKVEMNIIKKI